MRSFILILLFSLAVHAADTLIVADEFPAMERLSAKLRQPAEIVDQAHLPPVLASYPCVVVYIHKDITPEAEHAFIRYAEGGGRLVLLHHSISSAKRKNKDWLPWLGVELPDRPFDQGGYKWIDPADFEFFNSKGESIEFKSSEVYLNHVLSGPRTTLWWLRYQGKESPTAGWWRRSGSGTIFYFMAGHKASDFDIPRFSRDVIASIQGTLDK